MQIFFGGKLIGGADDLLSLKSKSKLLDVLAHHEGVEELPQLLMSAVTEAASGQQVSLSPCTRSFLSCKALLHGQCRWHHSRLTTGRFCSPPKRAITDVIACREPAEQMRLQALQLKSTGSCEG